MKTKCGNVIQKKEIMAFKGGHTTDPSEIKKMTPPKYYASNQIRQVKQIPGVTENRETTNYNNPIKEAERIVNLPTKKTLSSDNFIGEFQKNHPGDVSF